MPEDTRGRVGAPRNVLYLTDRHDECDEAGCMDLLGADAPEAVDVLFVTFTGTARERLATWRRHADAPPANVGIVSVETGGSGTEAAFGDGGPTVRRVSDPSDLTGVGIAIAEFLSEWVGNGNRTVVCFDSLTALLQYLEPRRVFQFCNEITSKFESAGAAAHFHITPEAHDRQVLTVLGSLFDDRVSAADLGHDRREGDGSDADQPARPSGSADPSTATDAPSPAAADADAGPPDDPETADRPDESGFVFAGGEFSREATAESDGDVSNPPGADRDGSGSTGVDEEAGSTGVDEEAGSTGVDEEAGASGADEQRGADGSGTTETPTEAEGADPPAETEGTETPAERDGAEPPAEASGTGGEAEDPGVDDAETDPEPSGPPEGSAAGPGSGGVPERSTSDGVIPRTTATVVGVVVMLLLMSFFAAAFPAPLVLDDAGDGVGADTTTPEDAASGADADTTTSTATAMPTTTATEVAASSGTPTEPAASTGTPTPDQSTTSGPTSTDAEISTPTATTEPVSTETATPTPTPEDDGLLDDPTEPIDDTLDGS